MQFTGTLTRASKDSRHPIIWGNIEGDIHERFSDGTFIRTSEVLSTNHHVDGYSIVTTLNSVYKVYWKESEL